MAAELIDTRNAKARESGLLFVTIDPEKAQPSPGEQRPETEKHGVVTNNPESARSAIVHHNAQTATV